MSQFQAPPGTHDVLPPQSSRWRRLVSAFDARATRAGYGLVITPTFEDVGVFQRVGEATDVVRKEMYDFRDRGDRHLALRPEGTAPVVRAFVEHRPAEPFKAWYAAPHFRYERAQAGRYRQHHQLGAEALGSHDPDLDVEVVNLAWSFCTRDVGLARVDLLLNSLGDGACRPQYMVALRDHLLARVERLCPEHRQRVAANPLRVLDCKRDDCRLATADAPWMVDHLCAECDAHLGRVRAGLESLGVAYRIEPRLVRGLDYYTRTTFELASGALETAQNALGGGGRYDGLVEDLGGPATPGIGFGLGIERILLAADAEGALVADESAADVWVVDTADGSAALALTHELREAGLRADRSFDGRSMKAQMRAANRSGARLALIVGEQEQAEGSVTLRDLERGEQERVSRPDAVAQARKRLG